MRRYERKEPTIGPLPGFREDEGSGLAQVLARNIRSLQQRHQEEEGRASVQARFARSITDFAGSMAFVYLHVLIVAFWIASNLKWIPGVPVWDPSFVILAMVASVEAIFLSTFVLITQNRMSATAERRAQLDLQINLLAEHEVTKLIRMVSAIADHMKIETERGPQIDELKNDIAPEAVLDEIESVTPSD